MFFGFLYTGCEKDGVYFSNNDLDFEVRIKKEKVYVCHYDSESNNWHLIHVSGNALKAHREHGDKILNDMDNDGFYPTNECGFGPMGDCDDDNADVYPGAPDWCLDGVDGDCNGEELPCALHCDNDLDCCFCGILDQITWTEAAFYCREDFGYAVQYYLCPDAICNQWIATVMYPGYPHYNYCSYSVTGTAQKEPFGSLQQAQKCTDFLVNVAEEMELPTYCFPRLNKSSEGMINPIPRVKSPMK